MLRQSLRGLAPSTMTAEGTDESQNPGRSPTVNVRDSHDATALLSEQLIPPWTGQDYALLTPWTTPVCCSDAGG